MKSATAFLHYLAGTGLELISGRIFKITDATLQQIANAQQTTEKNIPNGYPGLGPTSEIYANLIPRFGTTAEINAQAWLPGELVSTTDVPGVRLCDGIVNGGRSISLNSTSTIVVNSNGTPAQNAQQLELAYSIAKSFLPNKAALSPTNRATIFCMPGVQDLSGLSSSLQLDTSFIDIIGIGGNQACQIVCTGLRSIMAPSTNKDWGMRGFLIRRAAPADTGLLIAFTGASPGLALNHQDLIWDNGTAPETTPVMSWTGFGTTTPISGLIRNCKSAGQACYGGFGSGIWNNRFEDCEFGPKGFGASNIDTVASSIISGGLIRCIYRSTNRLAVRLNCLMWACDWNADIQRIGSGSPNTDIGACKISYSRIKGNSTNPPISNDALIAAPGLRIAFCQLPNVALHTNVSTNLALGTLGASFNIVDDDI